MDLKRPLVVLATVAALAGCGASTETGGNTDLDRGEGECNAAEAGASEQELCEDTEQDNEQQTDQEDDGTS
ncbi:hypothetical protein ACI79G_18060 [Geodermatophilus sp. SYSU D00779]